MHCFMPRLFACLASLTGCIWNLERTYLVMLSKVEHEIIAASAASKSEFSLPDSSNSISLPELL